VREVEHRGAPDTRIFVPPSWFIVLAVVLCIGSAGWLGWLFLDNASDTTASPKPTVTATPTPPPTTTTPEPTPTATTTTTPKPKATKKAEPAPVIDRSAPVSVLNNTTITGYARTFSYRVSDAGWTISGIGNWRGSIPGNTIYYPPGFYSYAVQLSQDVGISRLHESVDPMKDDRLTIILAGPQ
jgi:hypothetical protein